MTRQWRRRIDISLLIVLVAAGIWGVYRRAENALFARLGYSGPRGEWFRGYFMRRVQPGMSITDAHQRMKGYDEVKSYLVPTTRRDSLLAEEYGYRLFLNVYLVAYVYYDSGYVVNVDPNGYGISSGRRLTPDEAQQWIQGRRVSN
jgi:hypothetical protein